MSSQLDRFKRSVEKKNLTCISVSLISQRLLTLGIGQISGVFFWSLGVQESSPGSFALFPDNVKACVCVNCELLESCSRSKVIFWHLRYLLSFFDIMIMQPFSTSDGVIEICYHTSGRLFDICWFTVVSKISIVLICNLMTVTLKPTVKRICSSLWTVFQPW